MKKLHKLYVKIKSFIYRNTIQKVRHNNEIIRHNNEIKKLCKQYANIPKKSSTGVRAFWLIAAFVIALTIAVLLFVGYLWINSVLNLPNFTDKGEFQGVLNEGEFQSAFIYPLTLFVLSPIAFFVWCFRDANKRLEIDNTRKDTNLKEFQRLQEWATGNFSSNPTTISDENTQEPTNHITLQISALHSLRPYLKGEYGESFRRGAYEIYRSLLKQQHNKILAKRQDKLVLVAKDRTNILKDIKKCELTAQLNTIAEEEWFNLLINHDFPTKGMSLVGVNLFDYYLSRKSNKGLYLQRAKLEEVNLQDAHLYAAQLQRAKLEKANLQGANLRVAKLQGANLRVAKLQGADLRYTQLQGAYLSNAQLQGANLRYAQLQGANLRVAQLQGADLRYTQLQGANLQWANLQGATLRHAQLQGVDLSKAQLQGADLEKAQLQGVYSDEAMLFDFVERINERTNKSTDLRGILTALNDEQKNEIIRLLKEYRWLDNNRIERAIKRIQDYTEISSKEWTENTTEYTKKEAKVMIKKYNKALKGL